MLARPLTHYRRLLTNPLTPAPGDAGNIRGAPPQFEGGSVQLPGEPELAIEAERRAEGIPVPGRTWHGFEKIAEKLGVECVTRLASPVACVLPSAA